MIFLGIYAVIHGNLSGVLLIILGSLYILLSIKESISKVLEIERASIDRSEDILHKIGGVDNIDINLSKYGNDSQLIVLKNKTIHIGHNNYEIEKVINFDSVIKLEIRVNNAKVGTAYQYSKNKNKEIIESIVVYIHTNEYTEELIFKYSSYDFEGAQTKYNEILKGLKRLQVMLEDSSDSDRFDKATNINGNEKSIPEQIEEYKGLLDIGAITEDEYDSVKKKLLRI